MGLMADGNCGGNSCSTRILIGAIAVAGLTLVLDWLFPGILSDIHDQPLIAHHAIWMVVLISALMAGRRIAAGTILRYAVIGAGLILTYSNREDFRVMGNRILGELFPDRALVSASVEVTLRRGAGGHFRVTADVNGKPIRFLIDTGASLVALSPKDARTAGYDPDRLSYTLPIRTANGNTYAALIHLDRIAVCTIRASKVKATVSRQGLEKSLLGLSFLNHLSGYEFRSETLILKL
ncbi:MAG: TIGR02281 family clan AA aspartic protease [Rhodospirillaceae bacterium]|nr:TIGR02281 family clan AA aspartic protease [Rhodospirillaceae bacterium]